MKKRNILYNLYILFNNPEGFVLKLPLKLEYRTTWCCGIDEYMAVTKDRTTLKK